MTRCSRLGVEILKPLVLVVRGLKNTVGCLLRVAREPQSGLSRKNTVATAAAQTRFQVQFQIGCWLCRHALRSRSASWGVQVGVCKLGCALGIHDDKCVVFSVASYSVLVGQMPLVSYGM